MIVNKNITHTRMTKYQTFLLFIFNFLFFSAQQKFNINGTVSNSNNTNLNTPIEI